MHYLSGPFGVEGAEPGDLLVVDINDIGWLEDSQWGFTGIFALENGGGFLDQHFPEARKACWDFHGVYTSSRHIPGVRFPGIIHPGLIGTLPSHDLLKKWNEREEKLWRTNPTRVPPLATMPDGVAGTTTALMGQMKGADARRRRQGGRAHRARPRARRQLRHQEPVARLAGVLPGLRQGRRALDGRHSLVAG